MPQVDRAAPLSRPPLPPSLRAAIVLVSIEAAVEVAVVAGRGELTGALRVALVACISLKWLFAWRASALRAGGALGLLLLEGTTVVAALGATTAHPAARAALAVAGVTVTALVLASLHAFPSPELP